MARGSGGSAPSSAEAMGAVPGGGRGAELRRRVVSALVIAAVAVPALAWGGAPAALLIAVCAGVMGWEFRTITARGAGDDVVYGAGFAAAALAAGFGGGAAALAVLAATGAGFVVMDRARGRRGWWPLVGAATAGLAATAFAALRADPAHGLTLALWVAAVTVATDVGAFFAGRAIGGPKLWPSVSPKKTWAGLGGGVALAVGVSLAFSPLTQGTYLTPVALVSALAAIVAQGGDLAESALKRRFGVKDSSALIPGHGGALDRLDGFSAVALIAAAFTFARGAPVYAW